MKETRTDRARNLVYTLWFWCGFLSSMTVLWAFSPLLLAVERLARRRGDLFQCLFQLLCRGLWLVCPSADIRVRGFSKIQRKKPALYVCNHQSFLDVILLLSFPLPWRWFVKQTRSRTRLMLPLLRCRDDLVITGLQDLLSMKERAGQAVRRGLSLPAFVEGTRSSDRTLGRFRNFFFHLAEDLELDIIPVVIDGTNSAWPRGSRLIRPVAATVTFLDRIPAEELRRLGASGARKLVRTRMKRELERIRKDVDERAEALRARPFGSVFQDGIRFEQAERLKRETN